MSDETRDPLLELYRSEVQQATAQLARGIVTLELGPLPTNILNEMVEAVKSIRSSARIVGLEPVCRLTVDVEKILSAPNASENLASRLQALQEVVTVLGTQVDLDDQQLRAWPKNPDLINQLAQLLNKQASSIPVPSLEPEKPRPVGLVIPTMNVSVEKDQLSPSFGGTVESVFSKANESDSEDILSPIVAVSSAEIKEDETPEESISATLLELFREEVQNHTEALDSGLLALEQRPNDTQLIEPLMRAAHSLKGAARIVGVDAAVNLAHVLEDVLVAAQVNKVTLQPTDVDVFIQTNDLLKSLRSADETFLRQWSAAHQSEVSQLIEQLDKILLNQPRLNPQSAKPVPVTNSTPAVVEPVKEILPRENPPPPSKQEVQPASRIEVPPAPPKSDPESIVKVSAQTLNRLLGLAGESMVQARWLQTFASGLGKLKRSHDQLGNLLDRLSSRLLEQHVGESTLEDVAQSKRVLSIVRQTLIELFSEFENHAARSDDLNSRLYREVLSSRMRPFADGLHGLPRLVRDMAKNLGKQVELVILGDEVEVDRDILERLESPLTHMLRNSIDHGIELPEQRIAAGKPPVGQIVIDAKHRAGMLSVTIRDDGRGVDLEKLRTKIVERQLTAPETAKALTENELLEFLFLPGFSTASKVTEYSGRGVGLDVVQGIIRQVGGTVRLTSKFGEGTTFHLILPLTLSVVRAVLVKIAGEPYAFPHNRIERLLRVPASEVRSLEGKQFIIVDGVNVGLVSASQVMELTGNPPPDPLPIILLSDTTGQYGLVVENFIGEQDLVVRPLDARLGKIPNISAAAILDDGSPVLIADVDDLMRTADVFIQANTLRKLSKETGAISLGHRKRVLVVDDSPTVREVERQLLNSLGLNVETAQDGQEGWNRLRTSNPFDLVVSDVDMPRMTGYEFVRLLRSDPRFRTLPVIMVSYKDRPEDRAKGKEVGADVYLTKTSLHDNTFTEAVRSLMAR
jgi:two-component system sensor histidine kinase and response regulator WspE